MTNSKKSIQSDEKLSHVDFDLWEAIDAVDRKDYGYWRRLTVEQQRKFVPYMMIMWISSVQSKTTVEQYYLLASNQNANLHLFNERIVNHPELQWLMLCTVSPGIGKQKHTWIPHLSSKYAQLQEKLKAKDIQEYLKKTKAALSQENRDTISYQWSQSQNHKFQLSKIYPTMKLEDIDLLAELVTPEMIKEYERQSGIE